MRFLKMTALASVLAAAAIFGAVPASGQTVDFLETEQNYHVFLDDFHNFEVDQWIVTEVGSGSRAVADADGGILVITNAGTDNDHNFLQWSGDDDTGTMENWTFTSGKRLYFEARFKVSDATQSDFVMGLQVTDTSPLATADGIWFGKDDGDAFLDFHVAVGSVQSNTPTGGVATVADDTYLTVAAYYNGSAANFQLFVNGAAVGSVPITNAPTTELTISFGLQDGEAEAQVMSVDYVLVAKER